MAEDLTGRLPSDVSHFLKRLEMNHAEIFKEFWRSPCPSCNNGEARLVYRNPESYELGNSLKSLVEKYKI